MDKQTAITISKQVASKLTNFGFPNNPMACEVTVARHLTSTLYVASLAGICEDKPVFALVIDKGHVPLPAHHVLDFRVGSDIYGTTPAPE